MLLYGKIKIYKNGIDIRISFFDVLIFKQYLRKQLSKPYVRSQL